MCGGISLHMGNMKGLSGDGIGFMWGSIRLGRSSQQSTIKRENNCKLGLVGIYAIQGVLAGGWGM